MGRTTPLTSKRCILNIYSTNIGTEYFKHGIHSPFFFQHAVSFIILTIWFLYYSHFIYRCAKIKKKFRRQKVNPLTPKDNYSGRTAPLTSKRCILYIYSTNIGTEYFKHAIYSPFFISSKCSLFHNSNVFGSCIIEILYTGWAKIKKIPAPKG